jgi:nitrogen-specific signal transduction histidine kinase
MGRGYPGRHKKSFLSGLFTKKRAAGGLGLTLAKRIVEDYHKGRIFVCWSSKNKGTEFCVDLPVWQEPESGEEFRSMSGGRKKVIVG